MFDVCAILILMIFRDRKEAGCKLAAVPVREDPGSLMIFHIKASCSPIQLSINRI